MRVGINCLALYNNFECGAKEVLLNLCHGWEESGVAKNLVFFCYAGKNSETIKSICPSAEVVEMEEKKYSKVKILNISLYQTIAFHSIYKKYNLDSILFILPGLGLMKYKIPTAVIPHDIQPVSHPENYVNFKHPKLEYIVNKWFYNNDFKKTTKIVAISDFDKSEIADCFPKYEGKIHRIYDPIKFDTSKLVCPEKGNFVIATNIQYEHKNAMTLIKAFEIFSKSHEDFKLYLIGRKSDYVNNTLIPYVKEHGLDDKVEFTGFISREELEDKWRTARIYVNPSRYEGFGMTAVESVLMGAPTVLASLPVNIEVTENMCKYYGDAFDYVGLANSMEELMTETIDENDLNEKRNRLLDKYSYVNISEKYWEMIKSIKND